MDAIEKLMGEIKDSQDKASPMVINGAKKIVRLIEYGLADESLAEDAIYALQCSSSHLTISNKNDFHRLLKVIMAKNYISILSVEISLDKTDNRDIGNISTVTIDVGRAFAGFKTEDEMLAPVANNIYQNITNNDFAPFNSKVVLVTLNGDLAISATNDDGYTVMYCNRNMKVFRKSMDFYIDIVTGDKYTLGEIKELANHLDSNAPLKLYKAYLYSASSLRQHKFMCVDVTDGDNREELIDKVSNKGWSLMKQKIKNTKGTSKEVQDTVLKSEQRMGQLMASSVDFGEILSWVYIDTSIVTIEGETQDGLSVGNAKFLQSCMYEYTGIWILEQVLAGEFTQGRPDGFKTAIIWEDEKSFLQRLRVMYETYPKNIVRCGTESSETPVIIADSNAVKYLSDYNNNNIHLEILAFADNSQVFSSTQMIDKIIYAGGKEAVNYTENKMTEYLDSLFEDMFNTEASIPTPGEVASGYDVNLISKIAPQEILNNPSLLNKILGNVLKSAENSIARMRFPLDGDYNHILPDQAEVLAGAGRDNAVIKYGEGYLPKAYKFFVRKYTEEVVTKLEKAGDKFTEEEKEQIIEGYVDEHVDNARVMMIKYPSMGLREYYILKPLSLEEIHARINALDIPFSIKGALHRNFNSYKNGVSITPSTVYLMKQLAGLDYDFDSATYVYDQDMISFVRNQCQRIINIELDNEV